MARYDPHRTARRNCGLCWKPVTPGTPDCVTEPGMRYAVHFHQTCYVEVQRQRADLVARGMARP
jgi:hypothetical protein